MRQLFFLMVAIFLAASQVQAQTNRAVDKSVSDLMLVAAFGTGGAVLGLSTLPFYSEPSDHLKNILFGGAIGIIAGVAWVMVDQATESKTDFYKGSSLAPSDYQQFLANSQQWKVEQGIVSSSTPTTLWWQGPIFSF